MSMSVSNFGASVRSFLGSMTLKEAPEASFGGRVVKAVRSTPYVCKIDSLLSVQRFGNVIHGVERVFAFLLSNEEVERVCKKVIDQEEFLRVLIEEDEALHKKLDDIKNTISVLDAMLKNMNDADSLIVEFRDELKKLNTTLECLEKYSQIPDDIQKKLDDIQANCDEIIQMCREKSGKTDPIIVNSDPASSADASADEIPDPVVQSQEHDNHFTTENQTTALEP